MVARDLFKAEYDTESAISLGIVNRVDNFSMFGIRGTNLELGVKTDVSRLTAIEIPLPINIGESLEIVSSSILDTGDIELEILGPLGIKIEKFNITLNGTTVVVIPGLISRINHAKNLDAVALVGTINIQQSGGGTIFSTITPGDQKANVGIYTVPLNHKATILHMDASIIKSLGSDVEVIAEMDFKQFDQVGWMLDYCVGLQRSGTTIISKEFKAPSILQGPLDIKLAATASGNGPRVSGGVSGRLFDSSPAF